MVKMIDHLRVVLHELDKTHAPDGIELDLETYLPNFVVTRAGVERHFTKAAQEAGSALATQLYAVRSAYSKVMREAQFSQLLRSCVADLHAEEAFAEAGIQEKQQLNLLEREIDARLPGMGLPFGHAFPATTLGFEEKGSYQVGPVEIQSVKDWLESVKLNARSTALHNINPDSHWKSELLAILEGTKRKPCPDAPEHLRTFVNTLHGCDAVVTVAITGLEQSYSRELARVVARTALDGVSLLAGRGRNLFSQQALSDERLQPIRLHSMIVFKGEHWTGSSLSVRGAPGRHAGHRERVFRDESLYRSLCEVVASLIDSRSHPHPQLAMRWATALEWFAEGCRETSTSVAVTKLAAALDVLTCGETEYGIRKMLANLLGRAEDAPVFESTSASLKSIVQGIYGDGRSRLLHGNHVDRLMSFEAERGQAQSLAGFALVELLRRLAMYQGPDSKDAFVSMAPAA